MFSSSINLQMPDYIPFFCVAFFLSIVATPILLKSRFLILYPVMLFILVLGIPFHKMIFSRNVRIIVYIVDQLVFPCGHLLIIYLSATGKKLKVFIRFTAPMAAVFFLIGFCIFKSTHINYWNTSLFAVLMIIAILWKFDEMLQTHIQYDIFRDLFFYMLFALLLVSLITIPLSFMSNWVFYATPNSDIRLIIQEASNVLLCLLFIIYSIAFICMIKHNCLWLQARS